MCQETRTVCVKVVASHSYTGEDRWTDKEIDACIAPIVQALQNAGIDMLASCCGHGQKDPEIWLTDGRKLIIKSLDLEKENEQTNSVS